MKKIFAVCALLGAFSSFATREEDFAKELAVLLCESRAMVCNGDDVKLEYIAVPVFAESIGSDVTEFKIKLTIWAGGKAYSALFDNGGVFEFGEDIALFADDESMVVVHEFVSTYLFSDEVDFDMTFDGEEMSAVPMNCREKYTEEETEQMKEALLDEYKDVVGNDRW